MVQEVHSARKGYVEPLFRTNRMRVQAPSGPPGVPVPAGEEGHRQARDGPRRLAACRPPGPRVVYNLDDSNGVGNGSGDFGDLPWKPHAFRKRGEGMTCAVQSKICSTWGWSTNNTGFWDGPSGPYLWERSDGRFIAADHDAWGDPALIDLVWQGKAA